MLGYHQAKDIVSLGDFNVINLNNNKQAKRSWKQYQTEPVTSLGKSEAYGLVCGFSDIEVIDVDLKILCNDVKSPTHEELVSVDIKWKQILAQLRQSIYKFDDKVMIVKTKNMGYHIIYRAKNIEGNLKLAKNKDNKALIETRGKGGYVVMYDDFVARDYTKLRYILKNDRNALIDACRSFNEVVDAPFKEFKHKQDKREVIQGEILPIDDFKARVRTLDLLARKNWQILNEDAKGRTRVLRPGNTTSDTSGNVFKDGNLFVFSSSTEFEVETLYNVFDVYRILYHDGDRKSAIKSIKSQGYGTKPTIVEAERIANSFPIDVLPQIPREYFESLNNAQGMNIDFMATTFLTEVAGLLGNSKRLEIEYGRTVQMNMYSANVGNSGDGKTPASNYASKPFKSRDNVEVEIYKDAVKKHDSKSDLPKPFNKSYMVNDLTPEMRFVKLQAIHRGIHQSVDELATIFEQGKKEDTSSVLLSAWSNENLKQERASENIKDRFVVKAGFSISGGIQPEVLYKNYDDGKANGLMARFLFAFPEPKIVYRTISREARREAMVNGDLYDDYVGKLFDDKSIKHFNWKYDSDGRLINKPTHVYTEEAEEYFMELTNKFKRYGSKPSTNSSMIAVLSKMEDYRAKFSLLLHILHGENDIEVGVKYVKMAQKLCDYYLHCHNKLFSDKSAKANLKDIANDKRLNRTEKVLKAQELGFSIKETSEALGISRSTVKSERKKSS
jgi:hypothetical protein